jgi:hypothetical protein
LEEFAVTDLRPPSGSPLVGLGTASQPKGHIEDTSLNLWEFEDNDIDAWLRTSAGGASCKRNLVGDSPVIQPKIGMLGSNREIIKKRPDLAPFPVIIAVKYSLLNRVIFGMPI